MSFKPPKNRAMVLKKGKVVNRFRFFLDGTAIPSITEKPVKSLGKVFDCSHRDAAAIQATIKELPLSWSEIWQAETQQIKFMIQAVYDLLVSPANRHIWGKSDSPAGPLCSRKESLEHILTAAVQQLCKRDSTDGDITRRLNQWQSPSQKLWPIISMSAARGTLSLSGLAGNLSHSPDQQLVCSPLNRTGSCELT